MAWVIALRLANYNPLEAKKMLTELTAKELYEAFVIYAYDKFEHE